ncbi:MAG: SDR family oxidoreductase [Rhodospirillum sp.]|nr:SDR family oxidoreductase [Rhodospirillum sp.]MCF8488093.1 SDR family oxidoreductase [Rhodospirillum sp.]MCF8499889.1 SDR family oxidoreductase [Rhodospirillum sp.]
MSDLFDVKDRVVVVTGGVGQLGFQFVKTLLERGAKVVAIDVSVDADKVAKRYGGLETHENLMLLAADITRKADLEAALDAIKAKWEVPHGLVNNAALDSPPGAPPEENGPFETYPEESFDKVMSVNTKGVFLACQVFGGAMAQAGRGSIVNVGSIYGVVSPDQHLYQYRRDRGEVFFKPVAYSASKSALYNMTRYLAGYWGRVGVRVNIVTFAGVFNNQDKEFLDVYERKVPLGRMADETEYNGPVVFLLSDAASYMTGSNMVIDGGFTAL